MEDDDIGIPNDYVYTYIYIYIYMYNSTYRDTGWWF